MGFVNEWQPVWENKIDTLLDSYIMQEDFGEFPPDPFHS
jgi:hypothetical protein